MTFKVDDQSAQKALSSILLDEKTLLGIEGAGAKIQIEGQKKRVPVLTGDTQNSIGSHVTQTPDLIVDEIGPETLYAPTIELGDPAHPNRTITPFVRDTEAQEGFSTVQAMQQQIGKEVKTQWPT